MSINVNNETRQERIFRITREFLDGDSFAFDFSQMFSNNLEGEDAELSRLIDALSDKELAKEIKEEYLDVLREKRKENPAPKYKMNKPNIYK